MRILFLGSGAIAVPSLRWLCNSPHEVVGVVTQPDRPAGRGRRAVPTPVKECALDAGLHLIQTETVNDPATTKLLLGLKPDVGISASFGQMIGSALLEGIPHGCLNVHPSLLPRYRGAAPVNWAIIRGEAKTGVCVIRLVRKMDAGPILSVRETLIKPGETAGELYQRAAGIACDALDAALRQFGPHGGPPGEPQDDSQATFAPKLTKEMGRVDMNRSVREVVGWVNGLFPWPSVQMLYVPAGVGDGVQVKFGRAIASAESPARSRRRAGTILEDRSVACADGAVRILEIQPAGSRLMSWEDFVNGRRVKAGDRFEAVGDDGPD
jgi:methionyl-tRNA formyltransferase